MKVFSHYPSKGIWQFLKRERINDSTVSSVFAYVHSTLAIQVWGLFLFIFSLGFARTSLEIDESAPRLNRMIFYIFLIIKSNTFYYL